MSSSSLITIISTDHGRIRREQRDISKRDLNLAVKHGTRQPVGGRWMIVHEDVVFIVNRSMTKEVTAYPEPLSPIPLSPEEREMHRKTISLVRLKPSLCKSHTVLVVDRSGSMNTHDIYMHRDRLTAAYHNLAVEFVGEQILNGTANNRDMVSLVEFEQNATLVIDHEPTTWVTYNKLLSRRKNERFVDRQADLERDYWKSNYLPALESAEEQLRSRDTPSCALSLLFISDGSPTDARASGLTSDGARQRIVAKVKDISDEFGARLCMTFVGFGNHSGDFQVMQDMAKAVSESGSKAEFIYCQNTSFSLGQAMSSLISSTLVTRTNLMNGALTTRTFVQENKNDTGHEEWKLYQIIDHWVYDPSQRKWVPYGGLPPGSLHTPEHRSLASMILKRGTKPQCLAMSQKTIGAPGAERLAYRCSLCDTFDRDSMVLGEMVAKETKTVELVKQQEDFHKEFFESQTLAGTLAEEFNKRVNALASFEHRKIHFLECSVLILRDDAWPGGKRGVLVEKRLSLDGWTKWTDNAGGADGVKFHAPINVDLELDEIQRGISGLVPEEDEEEEDSEYSGEESQEDKNEEREGDALRDFKASAFLQAFSHFSYRYTNKRVLVCDLQGVFDEESSTFELTDPAIHYRSRKQKRNCFGRTDLGQAGVDKFFATHKCSKLCRILNLTARNPEWRRKWHGRVRLSREKLDVLHSAAHH